jgi:hypothetical protein
MLTVVDNDPIVLKAETETCMRLLGVEKVSQLGPKHVGRYVLHCLWIHSANDHSRLTLVL